MGVLVKLRKKKKKNKMEKPAVTFAATVLLVLPLFNRKVTINYNAIKKIYLPRTRVFGFIPPSPEA